MKHLTICCDFDDTMTQLLPAWLNYLNTKHNLNVELEDITSWDIEKSFNMLSSKEIYEPLNSPEFWFTVEEKPDASKYIKLIKEQGHNFYVCTSSYYKFLQFKFDNCLFRLFPFLSHHDIITTYHKNMINCDILIDDGVHNIEGNHIGLLFDMPHNRSFDNTLSNNIERITTWEQAYNMITKISKQL